MTKTASIQLNRGKYTYHLREHYNKILHLPTEYIEVFWITHTRLRLFFQTTLAGWTV